MYAYSVRWILFVLTWTLNLSIFVCLIGGALLFTRYCRWLIYFQRQPSFHYGYSLHRSVLSLLALFVYSLVCKEHGVSYVFIFVSYSHIDIIILGCSRSRFNWLKCHHLHSELHFLVWPINLGMCVLCFSLFASSDFFRWCRPPRHKLKPQVVIS